MTSGAMKIVARREKRLSPWVTLVEKDVAASEGDTVETYHMFAQADYVGVLARTPSGRTAVVRQFRPAIEATLWELVGGLLEPGEEPEAAARRELREEAGLETLAITKLAVTPAEVGRLENRHHCFFVEAAEPDPRFRSEAGLEVRYVDDGELRALVESGELAHPLHLAILFLFELKRGARR
jgi:8-oxo-dGTP pyrophosphatase MutT (NUDIX family)